jgi:general secretion pathway protein J
MIRHYSNHLKFACAARRPAGGFTLLEVLLAIFFFSIIITTLFGAYTAVFDQAAAVEDNLVFNEMARTCLKRMILDLQSVYVARPPLYKRPTFDSPPDPYRIVSAPSESGDDRFMSLRFTSLAHVALDRQFRNGVAEIVYFIQPRDDDQFNLHRADRLFFEEPFEPEPGAPILCEHVKNLTFRFIDQEGEEHDQWDSETDDFDYATPQAIIIQLEIGSPTTSFTFETRVNLSVYREKVGAI